MFVCWPAPEIPRHTCVNMRGAGNARPSMHINSDVERSMPAVSSPKHVLARTQRCIRHRPVSYTACLHAALPSTNPFTPVLSNSLICWPKSEHVVRKQLGPSLAHQCSYRCSIIRLSTSLTHPLSGVIGPRPNFSTIRASIDPSTHH